MFIKRPEKGFLRFWGSETALLFSTPSNSREPIPVARSSENKTFWISQNLSEIKKVNTFEYLNLNDKRTTVKWGLFGPKTHKPVGCLGNLRPGKGLGKIRPSQPNYHEIRKNLRFASGLANEPSKFNLFLLYWHLSETVGFFIYFPDSKCKNTQWSKLKISLSLKKTSSPSGKTLRTQETP